MRGVSVYLVLVIGLFAEWACAQFLNNRPFPTYSLENMPDTEFSCRDKILGGYYADAETQCQMFHICVKVAGVGVQDFRFLCPNGTAFDQDHQICADWEDVDCDATTLYYSSDNFDLYRIGSGFESKAVKYGEDEETFALQRAETGDARLNREHQTQRVNQQKESTKTYYRSNNKPRPQYDNNNNQERDIFKGSSSSNFFNNKNNGKENDEDYDDGNVNANQDRDTYQKKKIIRKQHRRPVANQENTYKEEEPQRIAPQAKPTQQPRNRNNQQQNYNRQDNYDEKTTRPQAGRSQQQNYNRQDNYEEQTSKPHTARPQRPTGFVNNFAGSSYIPTTSKPSSTTINNEQYTTALNNYRLRNGNRRPSNERQYNNADSFRQTPESSPSTPAYTVSTPAPFRRTQQYNPAPQRQQNTQYNPTTLPPKKATENYPTSTTTQKYNKITENYPSQAPARNTQAFNQHYDIPKTKQTENYPSTPAATKQTQNTPTTYNKPTTFKHTENYPSNNPSYFDKKPTTPIKQTENYPTTYAPKTKNYQTPTQFTNNQSPTDNFPTTFAPRTNAAYTQVSQHTTQYKNTNTPTFNGQSTQHFNPPTGNYNAQPSTAVKPQSSTPKSSPFTQYTPTVPKIVSTTPVSRSAPGRSSRYDETQYDDGSYDTRYDESLKTAHSQNIASSRNEYSRTSKPVPQVTQKPTTHVTQKPYHESPRPFSVSPNTPKVTDHPKNAPKAQIPVDVKKAAAPKKKDYDYAYYDTNVGSEPEYEIETDIKKSTVKN